MGWVNSKETLFTKKWGSRECSWGLVVATATRMCGGRVAGSRRGEGPSK